MQKLQILPRVHVQEGGKEGEEASEKRRGSHGDSRGTVTGKTLAASALVGFLGFTSCQKYFHLKYVDGLTVGY
ncbi:hypothetical protein AAMO2058_001367100 [Amorphochlora amoebiformis]